MYAKITFDFPNLPKGGEIDIHGLNAIFENGKTYNIPEDMSQQFRTLNARPVVPVPPDPQAPIEYEDGLIIRQRNYDCFEPF